VHTDTVTGSYADKVRLDHCHSFILAQLQARKPHASAPGSQGRAITICHQTGAGAHEIATLVSDILQAAEPRQATQWTVFDRDLVAKVLEEHHLPQSLAALMPEDRRTWIQDLIEEMVGLRPTSWDLVPQITETVLHLADTGHVILVGRGANLITARLPNVFHVRLIAPLPERIERVARLDHLDPDEAARLVASSDRGHGRYLKAHFHAQVEDPSLYHMTLNTGWVPLAEAAQLIADGARRCLAK